MPLSTPLHISLLVHYNGCCNDFETRGAPAVEEYLGHLLTAGLLRRRLASDRKLLNITAEFKTTTKGQCMVESFCSVLGQGLHC